MVKTEIVDEIIIREILQGEKEKYALLMQKYNQRLYRIGKGYIRGEEEIEDLMQETYIKGFQNLSKFENRSQFGTWITRILINECLQYIKKEIRIATESENKAITMNISNNHNPESRMFNKELKDMLEKQIDSLPEKYKVVFLMREIEKISIEETSVLLDISIANVKIRFNRAKEMLRKSLMQVYSVNEVYEFNLIRCNRIAVNVMARI